MATGRPVPRCCRMAALDWAWACLAHSCDIDEQSDGTVLTLDARGRPDWYLLHLFEAARRNGRCR